MADTTDVQLLLADAFDTLITTDDLTALLVDWYAFSPAPEAFIEVRYARQWVPIHCDVRSFEATVGRALTFESVEAGLATIHISNRGGQYTRFAGSEPALSRSSEIRLRVRYPSIGGGGVEAVVWHGFVIEWEQDWQYGDDAIVITAADAISLLSEQGGTLGWTTGLLGDSVAQRLASLVARVGLHDTRCYFQYGDTKLINPEVQTTTVLQEAFTTALTDGGRFFADCDRDGFYYVYLDRHRFERPPIQIAPVYTQSKVRFDTGTEDFTPQPFTRRFGLPRPAQLVVPLFSDWCVAWDRTGVPYSDLTWRYTGWQVPSIIAVTNTPPEQKFDANGDELPLTWEERGAIAVTDSRKHQIVEYTGLRFTSQNEAERLAKLYATVVGRSYLEIDSLVVYPELDTRLWDVVNLLRQGDWIKVERHLQTHRFLATCVIEGIAWSLVPEDSGGQPRWKVTYRLSSVNVDMQEVPPSRQGPRPAGYPDLAPPLPDPLPPLTVADFGSGSTFTERGPVPFHFSLAITDADHPISHQAFAFHQDFGTVELPLLADGVYVGDTITRQYGGATLAPGTWYVWARDTELVTRTSNQLFINIAEWGGISTPIIEAYPNGISYVTYTDHRFPPVPGQSIWMRGRNGTQAMVELSVQSTGLDTWRVGINTAQLPPDTYHLWVQDVDDFRRKSEQVEFEKAPDRPTNLHLPQWSAAPWESEKWEDITLAWTPMANAERYTIEYRSSDDDNPAMSEVRKTTTAEPFYVFSGGYIRDGKQGQRHYEVRVAATTNGVDSEFSEWVQLHTGYPYYIRTSDYYQRGEQRNAARNALLGVNIPKVGHPYWCQHANPNEPLWVGIEVERMRFENLRAQGINDRGQLLVHKRLMFADNPPLDDVRMIVASYTMATIPSNPTVDPPFYGTIGIEQWADGPVGMMPTGSWWGTAAPGATPTHGSWISGIPIAEGRISEYLDPAYPSMTGATP